VRETVRSSIQLSVCELDIFVHQRDPIRRLFSPLLEQLVNALVIRIRTRRRVPFDYLLMSLVTAEHLQP
jgi:hypothetical protein